MKLLMVSGKGATETAAGKRGAFWNTLEELHTYFERIDIICPASKLYNSIAVKLFDNVYFHPSPWRIWRQPWWILEKGSELISKYRHDVMTVHEYPPFYNGLGAWMLWRRTRVPYALEIMHIPGLPKAASSKETLYRWLAQCTIARDARHATAVRVINRHETPSFLKAAGVPREKLRYVHANYIDLNIFKPVTLEKKYDLIFIARLEKNKGIELFLEAVQKLKVKMPHITVLIIGDGALSDSAKQKVQTEKLRDSVIFHGWAEDAHEVAKLINESRLLVMCSYNEGGPRVILEAMACGVPVLATRVGIVPDIIPAECIIDWSADDIAERAAALLRRGAPSPAERAELIKTASQFEKRAAIKRYAEFLYSVASL